MSSLCRHIVSGVVLQAQTLVNPSVPQFHLTKLPLLRVALPHTICVPLLFCLSQPNSYDVYVESSTTLTEGGGRPGEADYLDHVGQIDVLKVYQPRARPARLFDQIGYGVGYVDDFVWRGA